MELIDPALAEYCNLHTTAETAVLASLNRDTQANVLMPRMLSGHLQGRVLALFSHMIRPNYILEIGAYTGYSAICMAEGLQPGGQLHTVDINDELESIMRKYWKEAGVEDKITLHLGDAREIVPTLNHPWDLVFIDADKVSYPDYYEMVVPHVRKGGFIIADNVLWSGKVTDKQAKEKDKDLRVMLAFNEQVQHDVRVENVLLPIRDGLMVARKL